MFQFTGLLPNLRAADNIALAALLNGAGYDAAYARAKELLARLDLDDRWDAYPGELSGGQQRRVALARALVNRPALLLADEPTNDLDERDEEDVLRLLRELSAAEKTTLIVVTHDRQLARQADRVISLRGGRVISDDRRETAVAADNWRDGSMTLDAPPETVAARAIACPPSDGKSTPRLAPAEPIPLGAGLGGFLVGFVGWVLLVAGMLFVIDFASARLQRKALAARGAERKRSQELALQQLRADLEDIRYEPDGSYEVSLYLQNFEPSKPFFVLGPAVRMFVQADRGWKEVPVRPRGFSPQTVRAVSERESFRFHVVADLPAFDELLRGYMHVRITNVMLVSEGAEPGADIFERTDDYYAYLKPEKTSEAEIRQRNGWKEGALVPRWIGMPAH
jgi:ABC-type multidrug transport system ATPase subunit